MIFPGGWNDLEISQPLPIKSIIAQAQVSDGSVTYGELVNSTDYFTPFGGSWIASPLTINAEPDELAVNAGTFLNENYRADAMNGQTKMANLTTAPPPMSNNLYLYGNRNGDLKYQMKIDINFGANNYPWFELSVLENAATDGGANGVVEAYHFEKASGNFTGVVSLYLMFDNYFGTVNLGLRAEDTISNSSIMPLYCTILNADSK